MHVEIKHLQSRYADLRLGSWLRMTVTTTDVIDIFSHFIVCLCVRSSPIMKGGRHELSSISCNIDFSVESLPPSDSAPKTALDRNACE
jgi:hypothetical protein